MRRGASLALLLACGLLAACSGTGTATVGRVRAPVKAMPKAPVAPAVATTRWPYPTTTGNLRLVDLAGSGSLSGEVALAHLNPARYGQNRAAYRLASVPAAHALVLVTLIDDSVVRVNGSPLEATTDAEGRFLLSGRLPTDRPLVVTVRLVGGLRLAALLPAGQASVVVNEASTVVLESLRLQLPQGPATPPQVGEVLLGDVGATQVAELEGFATPFLASSSASSLESLFLAGAGEALRSAAVGFLGAGVSAAGSTAADRWSDAWAALLGHRPLALTPFAGTGRRLVADDRGDEAATGVELVSPIGLAEAGGDLYVAEEDGHRLSIIPGSQQAGRGAQVGRTLQAGAAYALLGPRATESGDLAGFESRLGDVALPFNEGELPLMDASQFPMYAPHSVALDPSGGPHPHVAVSSRFAKRVVFLPGQGLTRYGATVGPEAVALLVGRGSDSQNAYGPEIADPFADPGATQARFQVGDAGPAFQAALGDPAALAFDASHHLWLHDAGRFGQASSLAEADPEASAEDLGDGVVGNVYHGQIRVVRASDGFIFTQRLTHQGQALVMPSPGALAIHAGHAYVADPDHHWVFRFALPAGAAVDGWATNPAPVAVEPVLGRFNEPGVLEPAALPGAALPAFQDLWDAFPQEAIRFQLPRALAVGADGRLWVGDAGRVWALEPAGLDGAGGTARLVAGGLDRDALEGDAHLAWLPSTHGLAWSTRGLWLSDRDSHLVRLLHVGRGLE